MKKYISNKKFISAFLALAASLSLCFGISACSSSGENGGENSSGNEVGTMPGKEDVQFTFSTDAVTIVLGDEKFIPFLTEIQDISALQFSSSDDNIATVSNQEGHALVKTFRTGTVTVTASLGEEKAECTVAVTLAGKAPTLQFDSEESDVYDVCVNDSFSLVPYVYFNGKRYYDVTCEYTVTDTGIAQVQSGGLVAKATGETPVTAAYAWRDIPLTYSVKTFTLQVKDKVEFIINEGKYGDEITLYTVAEHAGKAYENTVTLNAEILVNGTAQSGVGVQLLSGDEFVSLHGATLTALQAGSASLIISDASGNIQKTVAVNVCKPLAVYNGVVDFSTDFGVISTRTVFGRSTKIVEAYQDGRALEISGGKLLGVKSGDKDGVSKQTIEVYNDTVGYSVPVNVYLARITTADEFMSFFAMRMPDDYLTGSGGAAYAEGQKYITTGYVELGADIDLTGRQLQNYKYMNGQNRYNNLCAFSGTFDGKGHTVKNLAFSQYSSYGLFGNFAKATVKNVAFTDVVFHETTSNQAVFGAGIVSQQMAVLQDIYITVKSAGGSTAKNNGALFSSADLVGLTLKNVLVEYPDISENSAENNGGVLFGRATSACPYLVKNVFVVSGTKRLGMYYSSKGETDYYVWVAKDDADAMYTNEANDKFTVGEDMASGCTIFSHYALKGEMENWGTSVISSGNILPRRFVFDGVSPQVHFSSINQKYGTNGEIRRFDDYAAMGAEKLAFTDFIGNGYWYVDGNNALRWDGGTNAGAWKDDEYTFEGGEGSWGGNWNPEDETFE